MDLLLHLVGGAGFAAAILFGHPWLAIPIVLAFAFLREQAQHRDEGWLGWISWHRLGEVAAWGVGAVIAQAVHILSHRWIGR